TRGTPRPARVRSRQCSRSPTGTGCRGHCPVACPESGRGPPRTPSTASRNSPAQDRRRPTPPPYARYDRYRPPHRSGWACNHRHTPQPWSTPPVSARTPARHPRNSPYRPPWCEPPRGTAAEYDDPDAPRATPEPTSARPYRAAPRQRSRAVGCLDRITSCLDCTPALLRRLSKSRPEIVLWLLANDPQSPP